MASTTSDNVRMDADLKKQTATVLSEESRSTLKEAKELRKSGIGQEFHSVKELEKDLLS